MAHRIVVIGPSCSGKSSLIHTYTQGAPPSVPPTVTLGVDIYTGTHTDGTKTFIWDTAGGPSREHVLRHYVPGSHGLVLVYYATKQYNEQLHDVDTFMSMAARMSRNVQDVPTLVIGNKIDMLDKPPRQTPEKLYRYLHARNIAHRFLSCNNVEAVADAFDSVRLQIQRTIPSPLTTSSPLPLPEPGEDDVLCRGCQVV